MYHGFGFGKTILFGEHFVVYGLRAIVAALNHTGEVVVEESPGNQHELHDNCIRFPGVPLLTWNLCKKPLTRVLNHLGITTPLRITLQGTLPIPHSGIGSSAAHLVAFARALNAKFSLNLSDEQINNAAFEGEKEIHGNPSGIDNTAATYGGVFWFERKKGDDTIVPIKLFHPIEIVLIETGVQTQTKEVVAAIADFCKKNSALTQRIFTQYNALVMDACDAFATHDLEHIGSLMNKNHELLQELTVSCPELDDVVKRARGAGALGAKLTGTGRGGLAMALTPGRALQKAVADALAHAGYAVLKTTIAQSPPPAPENLAAPPDDSA